MSYTLPVNSTDLVLHVTPGCSDAAVYQNGILADSGHYDDVQERLIAALGVQVEYDSDPFVATVTDERGRTRTVAAATHSDLMNLQAKTR